MYKQLQGSLLHSEKFDSMSDFAFRLWTMALVASDAFGRVPLTARVLKGMTFPRADHSDESINKAVRELVDAKLIHAYELPDGRAYGVFHDFEDHNKGLRNLKYVRPQWPHPPKATCACVLYGSDELSEKPEGEREDGRSNGVPTAVGTAPFLSSPSSPRQDPRGSPEQTPCQKPREQFGNEAVRFLYMLTEQHKFTGYKPAIRDDIEAALARGCPAQVVEKFIVAHPGCDERDFRNWLREGARPPKLSEVSASDWSKLMVEDRNRLVTAEYAGTDLAQAVVRGGVYLRKGDAFVYDEARSKERAEAIKADSNGR